jgi:predicted CXXCH cytochrome family protein
MLASLLVTGVALAGAGFVRTATAGDVPGRTPLPTIEPAAKGEQCVAEPAFMRRNHMDLLKHQRDDTVFGGIRGARNSLKECIACHASSKTGSVAKTETNFCVSCHTYTAVKIDCFECHTGKPAAKPAALAQRGSK